MKENDMPPTAHPEYTAYNLRPYFSRAPGHPTHCLYCSNHLSRRPIKPSKSVQEDLECDSLIPVHNYSYLFVCGACGWWLVRESWDYCEIQSELDYIIVGPAPAKNESLEPWRKALADPNVYHNAEKIPPELAALFLPRSGPDRLK